MATKIGSIYTYLAYPNESAHHPAYEGGSFSINETVNKDTSFEIRFSGRRTWSAPFGLNATTGYGTSINSYGQLAIKYWNQTALANGSFADTGDCTVKFDKNSVYLNGTLKATCTLTSSSISSTTLIASRYGDSANAINLYHIKYWQNETLSRDFVPFVSGQNVGVYDKVNHEFIKSNRSCTATTFVKDYYSYAITASATTGGTVSGGGTYYTDDSVTLTATEQSGYAFDGWYENGAKVSSSPIYTFTASADRDLEAKFGSGSDCRFKVNGTWKNAKMYKKVNGQWVTGDIRIKLNNTWKNGA